jgi:hypothetical protein
MTEITRRTAMNLLKDNKSIYCGFIPLRSQASLEKLFQWRKDVEKSIDKMDIDFSCVGSRSVQRISGYRIQFDDDCWLDLADKGCATSTFIYRGFVVVELYYDYVENDIDYMRVRYMLYALV